MCFGEMLLELLVVQVILRIPATIPPVANMTSLMFLPAMGVQLIVAVKPLLAKSALGVTFEAGLVDSTWVVIAESLMFS